MLSKKMKFVGLAVLTVMLSSLLALALFVTAAKPANAALNTSWYAAAPYYMPLDNSPPDINTVMNATGQKSVMLAFILSDGTCNPEWGGNTPLSNSTIASVISTIRSNGGDIDVSAGGYNGTKLGQVCGSASATAAAYQQVINTYSLKAFDLDLEEPEYENSSAISNELGAAQILQKNNPGIYISITIPSTTSGASYFGNLLIQNAASLGFIPNNFSLMTFDGVPTATDAENAETSFHSQLKAVYPSLSDAQIWAMQGFSLMNGHTDSGEHFYQSDFQTLLNFALSNHMGRYTYWSVNRDRECPGDADQLSGTCSGVTQNDWDFTKFTVAFANNTSTLPTPTAGNTPTPTSATGCTAPTYNNSSVYTGGQQVTYNGHTWQAKWWTQGEAPSTGGSGVWTDLGPCGSGGSNPTATPTKAATATPTSQPPTATPTNGATATPTKASTATPTPSGIPAWQPNTAYSVGQEVTYNGVTYKCIQAHTSQVGWEPPNVPALWQPV